ncbi:MAG: nitroreductase family protein [Actinomycetaceae bacterium]|nr:nitroreductase family protein [Arcanobacterium sp.]MDD7504452.1 nitroreductase family protein [Actinomycetaceae bacterium]MDY6143991.1 nitroreductase family protein [Arcanobacterium sp.]
MNETITTQLDHRTIREFTDESVSDAVMDTLFEVAMHTATSTGTQAASVIWVKDKAKQRRLAEINGQEYVGRAPIYLMFVADVHRGAQILREAGVDDGGARSMDFATSAFTDACLMVQNVTVAAESLGLGVTILGGMQNDTRGVIEVLGLPDLTYPVLGMIVGHPNQEPALKPRIPTQYRVMVDEYTEPDNWHDALAQYDEDMQTYYDLRKANKPEPAFTKQVIEKYSNPQPGRAAIIEVLSEQGFTVQMPSANQQAPRRD